MSTSSTWRPCSARAAPRLMVVVVLPTPPFWLARAMTFPISGTSGPQQQAVVVTSLCLLGNWTLSRFGSSPIERRVDVSSRGLGRAHLTHLAPAEEAARREVWTGGS